jgi:hypothetical protein
VTEFFILKINRIFGIQILTHTEIDGKLIKENHKMTSLPLSPFWLKEDLFEHFMVVLMRTFNFLTLRFI